jgi:6-phosphogluconolactonase
MSERFRVNLHGSENSLMVALFRAGRLTAMLTILYGAEIHALAVSPDAGLERFYVGTYSGRIYKSSLDLGSATFGTISQAVATTDPSFVALTPNRAFLYSVNENPATVSAFSVIATNGNLTFLNQVPSGGGAPAHILVDSSGKNVLVANYNGGSVTVFPVQTDGRLGTATAHIQHPGTSPHAHCITIDASNHFVFVCDKGLDQIRSYVFDPVAGTLTTNTTLITSVAAGSGPRHMAFDPQYKRAYVICETASTVIGFNYDATNGILTAFQTVSTLPPAGFSGNTTAEIAVHSSGKFVYGSNRGYNTIVVYTINQADGTLTPVQQQTTGATPRNFAIDPTGAFCIVAGQTSNDIRLYTIDQRTGLLTDTGKKLSASAPVCILPLFLRPPQPVITVHPTPNNTFELSLDNTVNLLTYQLYRALALSTGVTWDLLTTGNPGQTNFVFTNSSNQEYFQVGILTNY